MKKSIFGFLAALGLVFALPTVIAANSFEVKAGVGSTKASNNKAGFDAGIGYAINVERFFAIVPEVNFNWANYDTCAGNPPCQTVTMGGSTGQLKTSSNLYTLPLLINARFMIPMGSDETPIVQPYVTVGAGYAWTFYKNETPAFNTTAAVTTNDSAAGFMYQGMLGLAFNLGMMTEGSGSATNLLLEAGYRGGEVEKNGFKFDMSGYVIRVGASFNL